MEFTKVSELTIKGKPVRSMSKGGKEFWGKHHLPLAYQEVEYLESSGTQFIDTGLTFPNVDEFKVKVAFTDITANQYVVGVRDDIGTAIGFALHFSAHGGLTYYPRLWRNTVVGKSVSVGEIVTVQTKLASTNGYFRINDSEQDNYNLPAFSARRTIYLFSINSGDKIEYQMIGRIYHANAYLNGNIVCSFIPCYRKSDHVAGMYETVNKQFMTNGGTGTFVLGPDH